MLMLSIIFVIVFATVMICVGLGLSYFKSQQKQQIRSMLQKAEASPAEQRTELVRPAQVEYRLSKLLGRFEFMSRLDLLLKQAGKDSTSGKLVIVSCVLFTVGLLAGSRINLVSSEFSAGVCALGGLSIPLLLLLRKRKKTFAAFEKELPEALDFLARSMRAGHGFSIGLEMLAADSPEPLGSAFRQASNDLQLGSSLELALGKLVTLFPLVDVRFFASSVLLQQETGGNLGEILSKLAQIIRERFRIKGQVKAASAHGRITGLVLVLMPIAVAAFIMVTTPQYLKDLAADNIGRKMIYGAIIAQIVGYFVIRKVTNIKV
jgi:tight adherence protein B